jgi:glycerol-3-phosphate dehydrogenase (NAD(P)+)
LDLGLRHAPLNSNGFVVGHVAEGVRCVQAVRTIAHQHHIDMPIVDAVARVVFDSEAPSRVIQQLLAREAKLEN